MLAPPTRVLSATVDGHVKAPRGRWRRRPGERQNRNVCLCTGHQERKDGISRQTATAKHIDTGSSHLLWHSGRF